MYFLVDTDKKIIFGWSAKCGCSHIKTIFWFLQKGDLTTVIHNEDRHILPVDITNYITLIFSRNPYERIISGFLDKYRFGGEFRPLWKGKFLSFSQFVDKVIEKKWKMIDRHHFTPQTSEKFNKKILHSKIIKLYDISNIDYGYIEQLYDKKIPEDVINKKYGHERIFQLKKDICYDKNVYDLNIDEYINHKVNIKYFYNEEIREKVFNFYENDFKFFNENGIDYINTTF